MEKEKIAHFQALRYQKDKTVETEDTLAEEIPIAFEYNALPYTVRLATPSELEDLALGLSLTEGIIETPSDLLHCEVWQEQNGFRIALEVNNASFNRVKEKRLGLIKKESNTSWMNSFVDPANFKRRKEEDVFFTYEQLHAGFMQMEQNQFLKNETGATHAAAWMNQNGKVTFIREDVGRHNALDKIIGALFRENISVSDGALLVTSRASHEMVHKCVTVGASILAAVSAPTALAVRLAKKANLSLVGFVRHEGHTIYSGYHRFQNTNQS